jgi:cytochrome c oxidase cbb3-type subunit 4
MSTMGHAVWTVILFIVFIGIVVWAYSKSRKKDFDEAARLAVDDEPGKSKQKESEPKD